MSIITPALAKEHLRWVYDAESATIQLYLDAAERDCANYINRALFADAAERTAAQSTAQSTLQAALDAINTARDGLSSVADHDTSCAVSAHLDRTKVDAIRDYRMTMAGIVMDEAIQQAVLLKVGHSFVNREDVLSGARAAAVELPHGSMALLQPYRVDLGV